MRKTPPGIPALPDSAVERIERGVFAALDARAVRPDRTPEPRRRLVAFAFAGAAVVGAFFGVREWRRGATPPARSAEISTTDSGSHIAIEGAVLDVAPHSAISFGGARDGTTVVVLDRGTVTCQVAPRSKRAPFVVEAGATRVTVIGTKFSVQRMGQHAAVSVDHGLVEVADTNMTQLVRAGERYRPGEAVAAEPGASAPPVVAAAEPVAAAPAPPVLAQAAAPLPAPHARPRRLAAADTAHLQPEKAPSPAAEAPAQAAMPETPAEPAAAVEAQAPPADAARSSQRRGSVQVLFELAAQLEVRDPVAALRIYGELSVGEDGWAASALFASARLEAERGKAPRARELCETYLRRFPRGPNAGDARTLLGSLR